MQQAVLDDWFLRQDILDQLMSQDEEASEAERYADRIMRIAQEDSAEHQVLSDPFDRSVALVLSLVKEEEMDPWNIDLSAFLKLFTQRVRKESSELDLPACGRLIRMSWEVLTQQASTLFDRVIAMDVEEEEEFFEQQEISPELLSAVEVRDPDSLDDDGRRLYSLSLSSLLAKKSRVR